MPPPKRPMIMFSGDRLPYSVTSLSCQLNGAPPVWRGPTAVPSRSYAAVAPSRPANPPTYGLTSRRYHVRGANNQQSQTGIQPATEGR
jgi:hypothetical protein